MSELSFDLQFNDFDIVQGYIRHFIGDQQYVDSMILTVKDNDNDKEIFTKENDDLVLYLQNPTLPGDIDQSKTYTVTLMHKYTYQFNYYDTNITVTITIAKEPQNIVVSNIPAFNWNSVSEHAKISTNSGRFFNDIICVIYLHTPNIEHYHLVDKSTNQTININPETRSAECDNVYKSYKQSKNITTINPKVHQITDNIIHSLAQTINNVRANMKTDGIRTLIVITNNIVQCYQHNDEIVFLYNHTSNIVGTFIFDCELCLGQLHLFDCYVYTKNNQLLDVSVSSTDDRIAFIKEFTSTYNEFIGTDMISGKDTFARSQYMFMKTAMTFSEFFESVDFNNNVISKFAMAAGTEDIRMYNAPNNYVQWLSRVKNTYLDNNMLQNYVKLLIDTISTIKSDAYKSAYDLCMYLEIPTVTIMTYSPVLVEGLIGYYYKLGFLDNERKLKQYAIHFANTCRNNGSKKLPISFTEMLQQMYDEYQYANDGIIFVLNSPLTFDGSTIYYKWKPRDKLSADVKLVFDESNVSMPFDGSTNMYVTANIMYTTNSSNKHYNNYTSELLLNNFNHTLPMCENGDIVTNESIVEIVPQFNGVDFSYKLLKIRYDKVNTNAKRTIDTIFDLQRTFINVF